MAYFVLAVLALMIAGGTFALIGATVYVLWQKYILGSDISISELFKEF